MQPVHHHSWATDLLPQPKPTTFGNGREKEVFFFKDNPWRPSKQNGSQKIYFYCIGCGTPRMSLDKWNHPEGMRWMPPLVCTAEKCHTLLKRIDKFVDSSKYLQDEKRDWPRIDQNPQGFFFDEVEEESVLDRCDLVYPNPDEITGEFAEVIKKLEHDFSVSDRKYRIDGLMFDHAEKVGICWTKVFEVKSDAFLVAMQEYRRKCMDLIKENG